MTNIRMNLFFKNWYSLFNTIFIKKNMPIKSMLKSLKKGPEIKNSGKSAIKYEGKLTNILSCVIVI